MSKERQEKFERIWSIQHAVPVESLLELRWHTQDGYRDPAMAAHYRTFNLALDSIIIALPPEWASVDERDDGANEMRGYCAEAIAAAGVKIA